MLGKNKQTEGGTQTDPENTKKDSLLNTLKELEIILDFNNQQEDNIIICEKCGFSSKDEKRFSYDKKILCNFCD